VARAVGPETPVALRDGDLLLSSGPPPGTTGAPAPIALPGRAWTAQAARPAPSSRPALLVLASGGLLSLLALTIAIVIARRDRFATAAVDRATRDVRESRESLRALATNSPDVIARYDRGLRCVFMNPAIRDATGLAPERFVGRTSAEAGAPQELVALWEDALRRVLAGEEDVELDFAFPTEAGERWFHSRLAPEHDAEGAIAHVLVTSRDVTSQTYAEQALRRSEDRYRSLVESMSDGVVVQDASGAIVSSNSAAEGILGLSAGQLAGRDSVDPRWRAIAEDGAPLPGDRHPAMRTLRSGVPLDAQIMGVHRPDGSLVWLSVSTRLRDDDGGRGVIACFTDITARVEADREQAALRRVATAVAEHRDQPALLALVARETAELIGAEAAGVVRFDDALTGTVMGVHAPGHVGAAPGSRVDLSLPTAAGGVAGTGRVARVGGGGSQHPNVLVPGVCVSSAVAAPIRVDNRLWGAIAAVTTQADDPLGPATADRLERMGHLISLAVMSSDARARLATLASTDELTGLPNRRSFMRRLREEIERAGRHERPLSLVMIDVDHFKRINDTLGHGAGDRVLMGVAATLFRSVRDSETVARVGGEEFAWILPETDGSGAVAAGERVRASLADVDAGAAGPVTASMGVCVLSAGMDAGDLMRCADAALYRAKESGRDRVVGPAPGSVGST
jgi:diguanylate cyclase (GGDEF)-like protein/PAS domain S-box-containing protein